MRVVCGPASVEKGNGPSLRLPEPHPTAPERPIHRAIKPFGALAFQRRTFRSRMQHPSLYSVTAQYESDGRSEARAGNVIGSWAVAPNVTANEIEQNAARTQAARPMLVPLRLANRFAII